MAAYQALGKIRTVTGAAVESGREDDEKTLALPFRYQRLEAHSLCNTD